MDRDRVREIAEVHARPCPFCGGSDIRTVRLPSEKWVTTCYPLWDGCGAQTGSQFTSQMSLLAWNRIPDP